MIKLTLTLKMTTTQVVETSVIVNNSSIREYVHPGDHAPPTYKHFSFKSLVKVIINCHFMTETPVNEFSATIHIDSKD